MTLLLRSLLLLKEKEFQASSIQAKIDAQNDNFTNDISTFIESALSRTRRRIVLDRVFIDHPTRPTLLTSPDAIDQEVIEHFQNFVPITSNPPSSILDLPERWSNAYAPLVDVSPTIFDSLMDPPTLEEWSSTISSMPNDKAPGPSMISYEMLKHLGPSASALLFNLICASSLLSTPFRLSRANLSLMPDLTYPNGHTPIYQCLSLDVFKANLARLRKRSLFYLSQLLTPQGTHLLSWSVIYANSIQKRGNARLPNWYKNLSANVTIPDKPGLLKDQFMTTQRPVSHITKELTPCTPPSGYKKNWIVTMNDDGLPIFGKQIQIQPKHFTCTIVHWTSDCLSRPSDLIILQPCPGCDLNINKSSYSKKSVATGSVSCSYSASLRQSWILPMKNSSILNHTSSLIATVSWAEIMDFVITFCNPSVRLMPAADILHTSFDTVEKASHTPHLLTAGDVAASSSVVPSSDSQYIFYTDGSLINLGTSDVSMEWGWVQIVKDSGFLNSIATYKRGIIHDWPSSSRAEAAAIYAALSASPANSVVHIYTDSQSSIEGLKHCFLSDYSNSRLYYKTTNFELWAIIQQLIMDKHLSVLPHKVKAHSNFYWNDFADSLANTAHTSDDAILISRLDLATVHDYILSYDNVVCESNPRHLFKQYHQMLYMKDLLALSRFRFISLLTDPSQYMVDWALTWHTLMFQPKFDNSFTKENVSRHHTLKFQLFLDDLPTLESLKRTRPDLYVEILTCRSCEDHFEDFMHLFLCKKRRVKLHHILASYLHHLTQKIKEAELLPSLVGLSHLATGHLIVWSVAVCLPPFWKSLKL
ncbi:hypothetical protein RhiirA5_380997 [Rhizophagus irregularis]|uniref:RNase H type-1 domain-containing protein n=1 Tax=Rhizophagus irregularis TaxID=588596 RepID=A0A2N0P6D9_9GLOM|nr:hypothetical protein RhiirA5_380997 [Rhizophagus irregularis]